MAARVAIMKFFKRHLLPNPKSDWAETWCEASQWHRDWKLLKSFHSDIQDGRHGGRLFFKRHLLLNPPIELKLDGRHHSDTEIQNCKNHCIPISKMAATAAILEFFKRHLLLNPKSDWAETWWDASQRHRDSKLLKSFRSDIQDGHQGDHLEILQTTSPPKPSDWAETWWEASQWHRNSKLLKSFYSDILDGLKFFKRHLLLNPKFDWAETWWVASQWHRKSKMLKSFYSDIQDGRLEILQTSGWAETWCVHDVEPTLFQSCVPSARCPGRTVSCYWPFLVSLYLCFVLVLCCVLRHAYQDTQNNTVISVFSDHV